MTRPIERECDDYMLRVMPATASQTQRVETRRAFFAGAQTLFGLLVNGLQDTGNPDDVTPADLELMDVVHDDRNRFWKEVERGER